MTVKAGRTAGIPAATIALAARLLVAAAHADASDRAVSNVRPQDPWAADLVRDAAEQSPTVAALIAQLARTDVIVFVRIVPRLPMDVAGDLHYLTTAASRRMVLVQVKAAQPRRDQMAILGHELQHASEIGAAPEVRDEAGFTALLQRIGHRTGDGTYETDAAVHVAWCVRQEIGRTDDSDVGAAPS